MPFIRPDRAAVRTALSLADRAPSGSDTQPWRWRIGPSSIDLFADRTLALTATDPELRELRVACGAALHHLRTALRATGWQTTVLRVPDPGHPGHLATVRTQPGQPTPDDLALARAITLRGTDGRTSPPLPGPPVPPSLRAVLADAATREGAHLVTVEGGDQRRRLVRAVRTEAHTPADRVPAPDPTGRADRRSRHPAGRAARRRPLPGPADDGTWLAALATPRGDAESQLRAGEALSGVLLEATRLGLAGSTTTRTVPGPAVQEVLSSGSPGGQLVPQVVLRLGWAAPAVPDEPWR